MTRRNCERAERARHAYNAISHDDNDTLTNLSDLISDLLHFADVLARESGGDEGMGEGDSG